jgi:hypothetical protein
LIPLFPSSVALIHAVIPPFCNWVPELFALNLGV